MKNSRTRIAFLALLCGATYVQADILMLKNGNKVEGTIIEQTATGVRMKYKLTPKIMDDKIFPMAEINQVIKQRPEEVEVVDLRKLVPTADLLKADQYEQIIQDRLRPFVNKYPGTPEAKEVDAITATLQEEKTKVSNGQVKLEGKWLGVKESKGEAFNLEAYSILNKMRAYAGKLDFQNALREFDKFFATRPGYLGSSYYILAIPEAIEILDRWEAVLSKMSSETAQLMKQRNDGIAKLVEPDLSKTKQAISDEFAKWNTINEAEMRQRIRWSLPYKYESVTIERALKEAIAERTRLQTYDLAALRAQNDVFVSCYRKIGEGDYNGGAAVFARAQNMEVHPEFRDVVLDLRNRMLKLYQTLLTAGASGATKTSGSAAIGGTATAGVDSRVAQILAEAGGAKPASTGQAPAAGQAAPAPMPATAARPVGTAPAAVVQAPVQAVRPAVAPQQQQQQYQPPVAQMAPPMPVEEESNLQLYIIIGMALVIVGMAVAFMKQKKKG